MTTDVSVIKKGLLCSLIYAALNLDSSEIQLSDLLRYIREGRVNFNDCLKYLPKEIKFQLVPQWETFTKSSVSSRGMQINALSIFKCLSIVPIMPDLKLIVDRFIKELCLPNDFKNLVLSLINLVPCDVFLELDKSIMKSLLRIPPYECTIMAYILVAFKMCFGLDDHYEVKVSDAVEKINDENCYLKSYKLGAYSEPSDRLFSFREWCSFIQLRKIILCKYYLHLAEQYSLDIDDYVYMEQCKGRKKDREPLLSDEITMNLLNKIPQINTAEVIPKSEFKATLTPLSTYTDLVLQYFRDPDLRLLFSEDFTQYSLKYACEKLNLCNEDDAKNIILGVDDTNKIINKHIYGRLEETPPHDTTMVYVRNCENKNWLKTNQPSVEHIKKTNIDRDSDHGYDSNSENIPEIEISSKDEESSNHGSDVSVKDEIELEEKTLEIIEEEDSDKNIFDDDFNNLVFTEEEQKVLGEDEIKAEDPEQFEHSKNGHGLSQNNVFPDNEDSKSYISYNNSDLFYNPDTFDRSRTIKELVIATCLKYKIRIPSEYNEKEPKKRKSKLINDVAGESGAKRPRLEVGSEKRKKAKPGEVKEEVHKLIAEYYKNLENDVFLELTEHVKNVVNESTKALKDNEDIELDTADTNITGQNDGDASVSKIDESNTVAIDENENIEIDDTNVDQSSLQMTENDNGCEESQVKDDPNFDENEYDIKQLYVKVDGNNDSDSDELFGLENDPELIAILDKKIDEFSKGEAPIVIPSSEKVTYDSDDDVPLSVLKEEKIAMQRTRASYENLQPLVKNKEHVTEFKYWTRFYASAKMRKQYELNEPFNMELQENLPASFLLVIRECAGIIDCSPYHLYKAMVGLEHRILTHNR